MLKFLNKFLSIHLKEVLEKSLTDSLVESLKHVMNDFMELYLKKISIGKFWKKFIEDCPKESQPKFCKGMPWKISKGNLGKCCYNSLEGYLKEFLKDHLKENVQFRQISETQIFWFSKRNRLKIFLNLRWMIYKRVFLAISFWMNHWRTSE